MLSTRPKRGLIYLNRQVDKNPNHIAVADDNSSMTYAELDAKSDRIAAWLLNKGVQENEFVAVRMGRTKEFVAAALGVQKIGAAYVPIDLDYPTERVTYMLNDCEARITLTDNLVAEILSSEIEPQKVFKTTPENFAYMIYTSGSTGKPKGVVIQHKTLLNFVYVVTKKCGLSEQSRISIHPNFSFDASIEDLYPSLAVGGAVFIVPEEARRDVLEMRKFIERHKINGGSYSARFGQLLTDENHPLDMNYISLGGEAMTNPPNISGKVFNAYGPTEFTVAATIFELKHGKTYNPIPIGRPNYNCACFIVDKSNRLLPRGMIGELCLAGAQMSFGYWKRPELTAEKFAYIDIDGRKIRVYHTGDLARYNEDNQLEFCGRIDFQVKLRGFRIELGEIENRAAKFPEIVHAVAEVKKNTLVLYYTSANEIDETALKNFLAETLTDYMVPSVFMRLEKMPMTPSGKIDRKLLPTPNFSVRQTEYEPPTNDLERKLCDAFAKVLGMEENSVGRNDDFYLLGGDSLKSMMVMLTAGIDGLSAKDIFKHKTAKRIAEEFSARAYEDVDAFEAQARQKEIPATDAQINMIDYQFLNVNSTMHNLSGFYRLDAKLDVEKLATAVEKVAHHHPALSTVFEFDDEGGIVQKIRPNILPSVTVEEISADDVEKLSRTLLKPFNLFHEPLFRAKIFKCDETLYLFVDMHHTISDGTSLGVLLKNISKAYRGETLAEDHFYTYLAKESAKLNSDEYSAAEKYFKNLLEGRDWCIVPTPDYDSWEADFGEEDFDTEISVESMSNAEKRLGFSRNVLSIAAVILAMRDYCHKSFIRVDFINSNRIEEYIQDTVGLIYKVLPVAVNLDDFPSNERLLQEISRQVTESFANSICENYGSEDNIALRDALSVNYVADLGDASLLEGFEPTEIPLTSENPAASGHVDIYLMENDGAVDIAVEYQRKAYADGSMKRFLELLVGYLKHFVCEIGGGAS